jgi:hypothetical protein
VSLDLKHTEASFSLNSIDLLCLRVSQMPTSREVAISWATTTIPRPIILPLATHGKYTHEGPITLVLQRAVPDTIDREIHKRDKLIVLFGWPS